MTPLPIDPLIEPMLESLNRNACLVIEAPTGAGKTTRVPPALLELGEVLVLEPRRLAARMAARRVAAERGEQVGETVGYQVRFEEAAGPRTRLRFLTEGVLNRRLLSDPELRGIAAVVLDEFHERHMEGDIALALLDRLRRTRRPDLRLVVMSATLDGDQVARYLDECLASGEETSRGLMPDTRCPVLRSQGRLHPIEVEYRPHSSSPLEDQVAAALASLAEAGGDVLVFLPGAAEIRRAARACEAVAARAGRDLVALHGDLTPEEQDRAVLPGPRPKVILSTNVAESSLTIEGVTAVIDSGLARVAKDSAWTGLPSLELTRISRASAEQRAGRAGRIRAGRVIRLYPREDFVRRPERETPEILRRELSGVLLDLHAMRVAPKDLRWFDTPPETAWAAAEALLRRLGAVDEHGAITGSGREMARLPLHPRLAALAVEAAQRGAASSGCRAVAVLSAGERLRPGAARHRGPSDVIALIEGEWSPGARRLNEQMRRLLGVRGNDAAGDEALLMAVLKAFPDRVARRRSREELLLAGGGSAALSEGSVVTGEWMVAVEIEERRERGLPLVRLASGIEAAWLLDLFPEQVKERAGVEWNRAAERVESVSALEYEGLVIDESRSGNVDAEAAARLLAEKAVDAGLGRFVEKEALDEMQARIAFAAAHSDLGEFGERHLRETLDELCYGLRSFAELEAAASDGGFFRAIESRLGPRFRKLLAEVAPVRVTLARDRQTKVHYSKDRPPWVASRLQDFFGMRETPRIAGGHVPLMLHLLAPNHRPVQMTTDLAGFWARLYPQVRRELSWRYPKHAWPEDPLRG